MEKITERPQFVTDEHLIYLDDLRASRVNMFGATNMYSAGQWLRNAFGLDRESAEEILVYWTRTFSERQRG